MGISKFQSQQLNSYSIDIQSISCAKRSFEGKKNSSQNVFPISFSEKPIINADIPALANIPDTTPVSPIIRRMIIIPTIIASDAKIPPRKLANRSSSIFLVSLCSKIILVLRERKINRISVPIAIPKRIS